MVTVTVAVAVLWLCCDSKGKDAVVIGGQTGVYKDVAIFFFFFFTPAVLCSPPPTPSLQCRVGLHHAARCFVLTGGDCGCGCAVDVL